MDIVELYHIAEQEHVCHKPKRIRCCSAAGCQSSGSEVIKQALVDAIATAGLTQEIEVSSVGCLRFCGHGPLIATDPDDKLFEQVTVADASAIVASLQGEPCAVQPCDPHQPFLQDNCPLCWKIAVGSILNELKRTSQWGGMSRSTMLSTS